MRLKLGPFSASSSGRVGMRVGPVGVYGGGRRRRRRSSDDGTGLAIIVALVAVCLVVWLIYAAVMWPLSLIGHALGMAPSWDELQALNGAEINARYAHPILGYFATVLIIAGVIATAIGARLWFAPPKQSNR